MKYTILQTIGNTPLIKIKSKNRKIYAKAEFFNPTGSIKDRVALEMIADAEDKKLLNKNSIIVEPTTGNTGISIAMIASLKGYKAKIVMPENMSDERKSIIKAFGAELILTPKQKFIGGALRKAGLIAKKENHLMLNQFNNINNIKAHEKSGKEIIAQLKSIRPDAFVAGIGTGGTLMGISKVLKKNYPKIKIFGVMPKEKEHGIQGIGDGIKTRLIDWKIVDGIIKIKTQDAIKESRELAKKQGLLVGISSGANILAAIKLKKYRNVVTVLPDRAERYLSSGLFNIGRWH